MKQLSIVTAATLVASCAAHTPTSEPDAIRDLIAVAGLYEVRGFRVKDQLHYDYVNDWYVTVSERRQDYLVGFRSPCRALKNRSHSSYTVDYRFDAHSFRAKHDTIRGCRVDKIYEVSDVQLLEIRRLREATAVAGLKDPAFPTT
jgi:hypothetical protein